MEIRRADIKDIDQIERIYDHIHDEIEAGRASIGWIREIYPVRKTAMDAVARGDLFVMTDGSRVIASAIINRIQVPEYRYACWKYQTEDDGVMVLHTLCIDPAEKGKGYGKEFVAFYEKYAAEHGCNELRMDTNEINTVARKMYHSLGYTESGIVPCEFNGIPGVQLVCLEKNIG